MKLNYHVPPKSPLPIIPKTLKLKIASETDNIEKICMRCKVIFPVTRFYGIGKDHYCKECRKIATYNARQNQLTHRAEAFWNYYSGLNKWHNRLFFGYGDFAYDKRIFPSSNEIDFGSSVNKNETLSIPYRTEWEDLPPNFWQFSYYHFFSLIDKRLWPLYNATFIHAYRPYEYQQKITKTLTVPNPKTNRNEIETWLHKYSYYIRKLIRIKQCTSCKQFKYTYHQAIDPDKFNTIFSEIKGKRRKVRPLHFSPASQGNFSKWSSRCIQCQIPSPYSSEAYYKAHEKRLEKIAIFEEELHPDYAIPSPPSILLK